MKNNILFYYQKYQRFLHNWFFAWKFKHLDEKAQERLFIDMLLAQDIPTLQLITNLGYPIHKEIDYHIGYVSMEPILIAAQFGKKEVFEFLLSQGAHLNAFDKNGKNALLFAILFQSPQSLEFISYLLHKEIDIHHRDFDYKNALCYIKRARSPLELYKMLRFHGADIRQEIEKNKNYIDFVLNYLQWNYKKGLDTLVAKDLTKYNDFVAIFEEILKELTLEDFIYITNKMKTRRLHLEENIAQTILSLYDKMLIESYVVVRQGSVEDNVGTEKVEKKKKVSKI